MPSGRRNWLQPRPRGISLESRRRRAQDRHRIASAPLRWADQVRDVTERVSDPRLQHDPKRGNWRFNSVRPDQLVDPADDGEPASQVTRWWQPDYDCDGSPDSVRFGAEIGEFRTHDGRGIAKIGHLTLDQEIEGSNPSSPARYPSGSGPGNSPQCVRWFRAEGAWLGLQ